MHSLSLNCISIMQSCCHPLKLKNISFDKFGLFSFSLSSSSSSVIESHVASYYLPNFPSRILPIIVPMINRLNIYMHLACYNALLLLLLLNLQKLVFGHCWMNPIFIQYKVLLALVLVSTNFWRKSDLYLPSLVRLNRKTVYLDTNIWMMNSSRTKSINNTLNVFISF